MSIAHDVIENAQRSSTAAFSPNAPELKALFCSQQESWGELRAEISTQEEESQWRLISKGFDEAGEGELGEEGADASYVLQGHCMDHQHEQEVPAIKMSL